MRILLISDIHGNLEALESCFKAAEKEKIDTINVLGDIVGYMANPNECVEKVKEFECILGNHDNAVFNDEELKYFNSYAAKAIMWTRENIKKRNMDFLSSLNNSKVFIQHNYTITHGSLCDPLEYIEYEYQAERIMEIATTPLVFAGHTHVPAMWRLYEKDDKPHILKVNGDSLTFNRDIQLEKDKKYIINIGAVGQPRDGNPKGCCAIYDSIEYTVKYLRFEYPVEETVQKIKANNLPVFLHKRLLKGE
ncbi:phosphodiesterase [Oxobacter pfennigii]|uniref:Phosphodiesterase n=1 Tax=Oxobacter pfennigii TaxID=36849 RepID=A0A0P8Z0R1_9CLOT|nr:metallophosphoesterase family protein [Oxobacter pfennigii]KPU45733.1 phosphodiesterase [Oxobacter pfennigii]